MVNYDNFYNALKLNSSCVYDYDKNTVIDNDNKIDYTRYYYILALFCLHLTTYIKSNIMSRVYNFIFTDIYPFIKFTIYLFQIYNYVYNYAIDKLLIFSIMYCPPLDIVIIYSIIELGLETNIIVPLCSIVFIVSLMICQITKNWWSLLHLNPLIVKYSKIYPCDFKTRVGDSIIIQFFVCNPLFLGYQTTYEEKLTFFELIRQYIFLCIHFIISHLMNSIFLGFPYFNSDIKVASTIKDFKQEINQKYNRREEQTVVCSVECDDTGRILDDDSKKIIDMDYYCGVEGDGDVAFVNNFNGFENFNVFDVVLNNDAVIEALRLEDPDEYFDSSEYDKLKLNTNFVIDKYKKTIFGGFHLKSQSSEMSDFYLTSILHLCLWCREILKDELYSQYYIIITGDIQTQSKWEDKINGFLTENGFNQIQFSGKPTTKMRCSVEQPNKFLEDSCGAKLVVFAPIIQNNNNVKLIDSYSFIGDHTAVVYEVTTSSGEKINVVVANTGGNLYGLSFVSSYGLMSFVFKWNPFNTIVKLIIKMTNIDPSFKKPRDTLNKKLIEII